MAPSGTSTSTSTNSSKGNDVNGVVRNTLLAHGKLITAIEGVTDEADLYDAGLTSMSTVTVMLALEDAFDVEFPETLLSRKTFSSISSIEAALTAFLTPDL